MQCFGSYLRELSPCQCVIPVSIPSTDLLCCKPQPLLTMIASFNVQFFFPFPFSFFNLFFTLFFYPTILQFQSSFSIRFFVFLYLFFPLFLFYFSCLTFANMNSLVITQAQLHTLSFIKAVIVAYPLYYSTIVLIHQRWPLYLV